MSTPLPTASRLHGVAEYYFSRKLAEVAERQAAGQSILNLGVGNPDLPPPEGVVRAQAEAAYTRGANGYQSYRGVANWRAALKSWYADTYGVQLSDAELLPLAGSKEGIVHLALAYVEPGKALLHPDPGYPAYAAAATLAGGSALPYPMPTPGEAAEAWISRLADALGDADARLLFVNSPHMPTGQVLSREHLLALVAFAKTRNLLLVSDNAYNYYAPGGPTSVLSLPGAREVAVELNSLSKSHHLPGWRVGVLVGRADAVAAALQVKSNLDSGQYLPVQLGAAAALSTPSEWHAQRNALIDARRRLGEELLTALGCRVSPGQAGLFVWGALPGPRPDAENFCDALLDRHGIFLPPGTVFGAGGAGHVRVSLCADLEVLGEALGRVNGHSVNRP